MLTTRTATTVAAMPATRREDFDFEAGEQPSEEDKAILLDVKRPLE